jgi:hypothetical protein
LPRVDVGSPDEPIVGMAKSTRHRWLPTANHALLPRLGPGQRTPIFRIPEEQRPRLSWYTRLAMPRPIQHAFTGIVRFETRLLPKELAVQLADQTTRHIPSFASRPEHDPRAPQNLVPIGALEKRLRHNLGDRSLIQRHLQTYMYNRLTAVRSHLS